MKPKTTTLFKKQTFLSGSVVFVRLQVDIFKHSTY